MIPWSEIRLQYINNGKGFRKVEITFERFEFGELRRRKRLKRDELCVYMLCNKTTQIKFNLILDERQSAKLLNPKAK